MSGRATQPTENRLLTIALAGNPNTGKTSLFNALCGARQRVGNYPGVTVERKTGHLALPGVGRVELIDLPGLYSLKAIAPDEHTAADVLAGRMDQTRRPDLIVFVLDSSNLRRNLFLYSQIAELGVPVLVAATMADTLQKSGIEIDFETLSNRLDAPVVPIRGRENESIQKLLVAMDQALLERRQQQLSLRFEADLEQAARRLADHAAASGLTLFEARELAADPSLIPSQRLRERLNGELEKVRSVRSRSLPNPAAIAVERYRWAEEAVRAVERRQKLQAPGFSQRLDRLLTHRFFGLSIFAGIMFLVFQSIYSGAAPLMDAIDSGFDWLGQQLSLQLAGAPVLQSLAVDGVLSGVGSVLVFLPQIVILFLLVAFLEDSGYMARAAFLMDRLLGWAGLNGRAFIPMLSSFACAIPGVMAARVIPDQRARMTTILISPLMSCSARLPVYLLLISAFIEPRYGAGWAALALFAIHALGLLLALPIAWLLNHGLLKTPATPFTLEMPPYRLPHLFDVSYRAYQSAWKFLARAGTVIFALSIVIWALSYFPRSEEIGEGIRAEYGAYHASLLQREPEDPARQAFEQELSNRIAAANLEQSYLGRLGRSVAPLFAPLGFDWKISVGILSAFPAREVIISTLGIVYNLGAGESEDSPDLRRRLAEARTEEGKAVFTPLTAISLMVFFALCSQCMSTLATVVRELNSLRWGLFLFTYMTVLAYLCSLAIYQGGLALGFG